jgi:exopolysaccharide production protein ExoZ
MRDEVLSIQYLRGFAALLVVFHHSILQLAPLREAYGLIDFGQAGVDIFFVISGFVIYVSMYGRAMSPLDFLRRRVARVAPLYWLATVLIIALALVAPQLFTTTVVTPQNVATSLLFIPAYSEAFPDRIWPLLVPGWSLNFEMFFYAVFALTLLAPAALRVRLIGGTIATLVLLGFIFAPRSAIPATYTDPHMLEFLAGVIIGGFWARSRNGPWVPDAWWSIGMLPLGVALLLLSPIHSLPGATGIGEWAIPSVLIVWGALGLEQRLRARPLPLLQALGDASYSLYLSHLFTLGVLRVIWSNAGIPIDNSFWAILWFATALTTCALASVAVYRFVEIPITDRARRLLDEPRRLVPVVAGAASPVAPITRDGDAK